MTGFPCRTGVALILSAAVVGLNGCAARAKRHELERVARDWCEVVRASQVLPVYPLTEDLQPGDVFLVTRPIGEEARVYRGRGFLPLDQHLKRLQPLDFRQFYGGAFGIGEQTNTPHHWREPVGEPAGGTTAWTNAPRAAFPSYGFDVRTGSGLKLALPVQGVPIGLGFLQAGNASGSITIADAYGYGVSHAELDHRVRAWSADPDQRAFLHALRQDAGRPLYLRVVNRVYLTGRVVVSLRSQASAAGEASGGVAPEVDLPTSGTEGATADPSAVLDLLNRRVEDALPGGRVKFVQATARAVTLNEAFDRPLVIGFLAFDFPILDDGSLGAPVSTLDRVRGEKQPEVRLGELTVSQVDYSILVAAVSSKPPDVQARIYEAAATNAGARFKELYEANLATADPPRAFGMARNKWIAEESDAAARTLQALRSAWEENLGNP